MKWTAFFFRMRLRLESLEAARQNDRRLHVSESLGTLPFLEARPGEGLVTVASLTTNQGTVTSTTISTVSTVLPDVTVEDFDIVMGLNVRAAFFVAQAVALRLVAARRPGSIINISSQMGHVGAARRTVYCASKHALLGLSRAMFAELKELNVRTICLSPGSIKSPMGARVPGQRYEDFLEPDGVADHALYSLSLDGALVSEEVRLNRMSRQ